MSDPRRHHIISKTVFLRRFTDENGKLWVHHKRTPARVYPLSPGKAFVVTDLNTIEERDGSRDTGLEKWYAEFEGNIAPVIERIVHNATERKLPELSLDQKNLWDNFLYHQQKRAPDAFDRLGLTLNFAADLPRFIDQYEREVRPLTDEERAQFSDAEVQARMLQRAKVIARGRSGGDVIKILGQRGLIIGIAPAKRSFIIGDHPLARLGPDSHLGHPRLELWFPISAQVAVSPWGEAGAERLMYFAADQVRQTNKMIFSQSNLGGARKIVGWPHLVMSGRMRPRQGQLCPCA